MGKEQIILSAVVAFVILATLGFSQEADASHNVLTEIKKWDNLHPGGVVSTCASSSPITGSITSLTIIPDIVLLDPAVHKKCVLTFGDNVKIEKTIYNYGTISIDPNTVTVTNNGALENHGTIIIQPIPEVDQEKEEKRDSEWHDDDVFREIDMFYDSSQTDPEEEERIRKEQERLKEFKNFLNKGTIINYGLIIIKGQMVSTGEIINKPNGRIEVHDYLYSSGSVRNDVLIPTPTSDSLIQISHGWPATIMNFGDLTITKRVDNGGHFMNDANFNGRIRNLCGGYTFGAIVIAFECRPYFISPADGASFLDYEKPIISWTAAEGSVFSKDTSTYNFWIAPKDSLEVISSAKTSNTHFIVSALPVGEYDYYVNAIHSDGTETIFDRQGLTIKPSMFEEMELVEIDKVMCSNFSLESNGPLNLSDIVIFTDDGEKQEKAYSTQQGPSSCTHTTLSYLILINPNGENEINWDPISYQLGSGDELYSTTFSGNCDGINLLPKSEEFWNCTITFNEIVKPEFPDPPPPTEYESLVESVDSDSDAITDDSDNCPNTFNPSQADSDGDGIGDACESVSDITDVVCLENEVQIDTDGDGINDACEFVSDATVDLVCLENEVQIDTDGDGINDACEFVSDATVDNNVPGTTDDGSVPGTTDDGSVPGTTDDSTDDTAEQTQTQPPKQQVPDWIKKNAEWWAAGTIGENDFVGGIQFLIKEKIIDIPDLPEQASDTSQEIPDWIKNNAEWWAKGLISEDDFVN
jgi:hypothetical protein